ncbi:hypothetical protein ANN_21983 [Periplaneta americana]|uniref:Uncharacterized protein n=1 Tax=Periplaneta americana TaxID=6978 RepID=A0ABQ8S6V6_PERAM|nr:hypothetical protein ANN_21983 [Periplaneta americana]
MDPGADKRRNMRRPHTELTSMAIECPSSRGRRHRSLHFECLFHGFDAKKGSAKPPGWLQLSFVLRQQKRNPVANTSYNGWEDHRANHTISPFWLDDRPPLLRRVGVRLAAGWSV